MFLSRTVPIRTSSLYWTPTKTTSRTGVGLEQKGQCLVYRCEEANPNRSNSYVVSRRTQDPHSSRFGALREIGGLVLAASLIGVVMAAAAFFGARKAPENTTVNTIVIPKTSQHRQQRLPPLQTSIGPTPVVQPFSLPK
jgi:hypothetical protein